MGGLGGLVSSPVCHVLRCLVDPIIPCAARSGTDDDNDDGDDDERFMLNLDMDDIHSYFAGMPHRPPPSLTMQSIHSSKAHPQGDGAAGVVGLPDPPFVSRVPVSPFHIRHPHLNRPAFATATTSKALSGGTGQPTNGKMASFAGREDAVRDNSRNGNGTTLSPFDPLHKLRLHAVPSPDLDVPSPLELPPGTATGNFKSSGAAGGQMGPRKIRMGLVPLAEPVSCYQEADKGVVPPSLSRS